eukprot:4686062-Prymnesium_polylepis.2
MQQAAEDAAAEHARVHKKLEYLRRRADLTREALTASEQADEQEVPPTTLGMPTRPKKPLAALAG